MSGKAGYEWRNPQLTNGLINVSQASANTEGHAVTLVAIGANATSQAGSPRETILAAIESLGKSGLEIAGKSLLYETPAFPPGSGPAFVNGAVAVSSQCNPELILSTLHEIEAEFGRRRDRRWGSRTLDLDLIAQGDTVLPDPETVRGWIGLAPDLQATRAPDRLILPHPRIQDRGFVLVPLNDIAPGWRHPLLGRTVAQMLDELPPGATEGIVPIP